MDADECFPTFHKINECLLLIIGEWDVLLVRAGAVGKDDRIELIDLVRVEIAQIVRHDRRERAALFAHFSEHLVTVGIDE